MVRNLYNHTDKLKSKDADLNVNQMLIELLGWTKLKAKKFIWEFGRTANIKAYRMTEMQELVNTTERADYFKMVLEDIAQ